mgnify:FL=1|jgi:hypothetical protein|tara:strand:- start:261 stop:551 length:291 start_codon:yes stop_codon:yes gene_type:complete
MELYKPFNYKGSGNSKFSVYVKSNTKKGYSILHFGDNRYEDYSQHRDQKRRQNYLARAKGIRNKQGELTYKDKNSANYWSVKLWGDPSPSWSKLQE